MYLEANSQSFEVEAVFLHRFVRHWLADAAHRFSSERIVFENGSPDDPLTLVSPSALHRILHILVDFALAESPPDGQVVVSLSYDDSHAHIIIRHHAPALTPPDAALLFEIMNPRDLSETGRPHLHRMQFYVACLLAERQQGHLALRDQGEQHYHLDLAMLLAPPE
jgi:hypothetical protein